MILVEETESAVVARNRPFDLTLGDLDASHKCLQRWHIDRETAQHFGIGYYRGRVAVLRNRLVIPLHNASGHPIGFAARDVSRVHANDHLAYTYYPDIDTSLDLFNLHRALAFQSRRFSASDVILVGDFLDCLTVHQARFESVVALMRTSLSETQEKLLAENFEMVSIMLSGSPESPAMARQLAARLASRLYVRIIDVPAETRLALLNEEELRDLITS